MWIAHYASGMIAKTFVSRLLFSVLALADAASDALFFLLTFAGLESFHFDARTATGSCVVAGALVALGYKFLRPHVKITPHDDVAMGAGMFDYPIVTFLVENAIFLFGLFVCKPFALKVAQTGWLMHRSRLACVVAFFVVQQAQFCFVAAPTEETRWVHVPLFLGMILDSSWLLGKLEA